MNHPRTWNVVALLLLSVGGCALIPPVPDPQENTIDYQNSVRAESIALARTTDTAYQRRMYDLIHRSRLVRTDSLAHLYVGVETAPDTVKWRVRQAIACEYFSLIGTYGYAAMNRASLRMIDSLQRTGFDAAHNEERMQRVKGPPATISRQTCGDAAFDRPRLPDSLHNVPYPTLGRPR